MALEDAFSLTLLCGVFLAGQSFPPRRRTAAMEALEKEDDTEGRQDKLPTRHHTPRLGLAREKRPQR